MKKILGFAVAGTFFIIFAGSVLHFVFEWLGGWKPAAVIAAVNESTWEHLKMAFWPTLAWTAIEYFSFKKDHITSFWVAKAVSLYTMPLLIILIFYGYQAILGKDIFVLDLLTFAAAVVAGQYTGYMILTRYKSGKAGTVTALILIMILTAAFSSLTYYPPQNFLFKDPVTGGYGIIR